MKNARKLVAAAMALAMTAALAPVNAFADTPITQDTPDTQKTGALEAKLTVQPSYTVTIPGDVTLSTTADKTAEFKAENVMLENGQKIQVKLFAASNTTSGSMFSAKTSNGSTANYTIKKGTEDNAPLVSVGGVVAEFTNTSANETQTQTITFSKASGNFYAGEHSETLTFSISLEDSVANVETFDFTNIGDKTDYRPQSDKASILVSKVVSNQGAQVLQTYPGYDISFQPNTGYTISKIEFTLGASEDAQNVILYVDGEKTVGSLEGNTMTYSGKANLYKITTGYGNSFNVTQLKIYYE